MTERLESLLAHVAAMRGDDRDTILRLLSGSSPGFCDGEFIAGPIADAWPELPIDARLIAYLLAGERADEDTRRGEANL